MIKRLIIGIKCLFGHHTEDPYVHFVYDDNVIPVEDAIEELEDAIDSARYEEIE